MYFDGLTIFEPESDVSEPMQAFVASLWYVGIEDGAAEKFLFVTYYAEQDSDNQSEVA